MYGESRTESSHLFDKLCHHGSLVDNHHYDINF